MPFHKLRDALLRAPLFWAALAVFTGLRLWTAFEAEEGRIGAGDPARLVLAGPVRVHAGGLIVSDVDRRSTRYGADGASFVLEARRIWLSADDARAVRGRIRVNVIGPARELEYGDEIVIEGELARPRTRRNPGGFDERRYLSSLNIHSTLYAPRGATFKRLAQRRADPGSSFVHQLRAYALRRIASSFEPGTAAFLSALYFGDRSGLGEDLKDLFLHTGTVHILAVSGFNIGFVALLVFGALKPFGLPKDVRRWAVMAAIWGYCLLVGWQAPVVRASVMASVVLLGGIIGRKPDTLNSLGLAALLIMAARPGAVVDIGAQLSFTAVWAIAALTPIFCRIPQRLPNETWGWREKAAHGLRQLFWVSFVCTLATLPLTVQSFYRVSPVALAANLAVVPLTFFIFIAGAAHLALSSFIAAGAWLAWPVQALTQALYLCLRLLESLPGASIVTGKLWPPFIAILIAGVALFLIWPKKLSGLKRALLLSAFVTAVLSAQEIARFQRGGLYAAFLDVGQGDAAYIEFPDGMNMLVDAGPPGAERAIVPFLAMRGVRALDLAVATHPQADHIGGFPGVFKETRVRRYAGSGSGYDSLLYQALGRSVMSEKAPILLPKAGQRLDAGPRSVVRALNPAANAAPSANVNNDSVVLEIEHAGSRLLLTGDIQDEAVRRILEERDEARVDVLKVPHHGARLSGAGRAWVRSLSPSHSVISAGSRNTYGHPHPETIETLRSIPGNRIHRTDRQGAAEFILESGGARSLT